MATLKQIEAARRNGAKSHGPTTPEGKQRSAHNATTHGLTASNKAVVLQNESDPAFQQLLDSCIDALQPADDLQLDLVREIAAVRWRLCRACAIETALIDLHMDRMAPELANTARHVDPPTRAALAFEQLAEKNSLNLVLRYQAFLRRSCERALRDLRDLQRAARQQPAPVAEVAEVAHDPEPDPNRQTELQNEPEQDLTPAPPTQERPAAAANHRERRRKSVRAQQFPRHLRPKRRARR